MRSHHGTTVMRNSPQGHEEPSRPPPTGRRTPPCRRRCCISPSTLLQPARRTSPNRHVLSEPLQIWVPFYEKAHKAHHLTLQLRVLGLPPAKRRRQAPEALLLLPRPSHEAGSTHSLLVGHVPAARRRRWDGMRRAPCPAAHSARATAAAPTPRGPTRPPAAFPEPQAAAPAEPRSSGPARHALPQGGGGLGGLSQPGARNTGRQLLRSPGGGTGRRRRSRGRGGGGEGEPGGAGGSAGSAGAAGGQEAGEPGVRGQGGTGRAAAGGGGGPAAGREGGSGGRWRAGRGPGRGSGPG